MNAPRVIFYHSPNSRSAGTRCLLEELEADYELRLLDLGKQQQRAPDYLSVNPMGKVPAIVHEGALITEQPAVYMYLADLFPAKGLAPAIGDPLRGPYLRWLVFYGSSFEPAMVDKSMQRPPVPPSTCPYGDYDTMLGTLLAQLEPGPYLLGERFTAADVLWGNALHWMTAFKLLPELPVVRAYLERVMSRPGIVRAQELDAALLAERAQQAG